MICKIILALSLLVVFASPVVVAAAEGPATEAFEQLLADSWEFNLREGPLFATRVGDHRFNDQLPRVSLADVERRQEMRQGFLQRLEAIDRAALSARDQEDYDIFGRQLRDGLESFEFGEYLVPVSERWGFHTSFPELYRDVPLVTVEDYENYIARLRGFGTYADGHIELMREGIAQGMTVPAVVMQRAADPIEAQIFDDVTQSPLWGPFEEFPSTVPAGEQTRLREAGRAALEESVVPGYRRFLQFMTQEYEPNCRGTIAASALPDGRDYYRYCVRHHTTLDLPPDEVHAIGLAEVARIRGEMELIVDELEFDGGLDAFLEHLRTDEKFYATSEEELLKEVAFMLKRMDGELPRLFGRLPRMPYGVREVPAYVAAHMPAAYYRRPTGDGSQAGFYYMNTYDLSSRPLYTVEALAYHEAVPGHHLQIALQQELEDLRAFRKYGGSFTAFVEGWGLYAEGLGTEVGFYEDPYSDFGRLTFEMWRACRLVVDTGIHYLGWTRQQAIDFMAANSSLARHDIRTEVDRYIGWPGQALAYKMGELKIRELRAEAEEALGHEFDVRAFHDVVLGSGAVPLNVLEMNVREWVGEERGGE